MKIISVFLIFFTAQKCTEQRQTSSTLGVNARVALLKLQIGQEIKKNKETNANEKEPTEKDDLSSSYEYVNRANEPITPIMDFDQRKKHRKFRLRELKSTTATTKNDDYDDDSSLIEESTSDVRSLKDLLTIKKPKHSNSSFIEPIAKEKLRKKSKKKSRSKKKVPKSPKVDNAFYRRNSFALENVAIKTIQCQNLITPFLTGSATHNITQHKIHTITDNVVRRLIQLVSEDVSEMSKEEIYSVLYQISNLNIRLFQWDTQSLKLLFNALCKRDVKIHTFRKLKRGLKKTFESWHLDFSNTTNLLKQARLFRPPCIRTSEYAGSTKTSKGIRYTKSKKPKCSDKHQADDENDSCSDE